VYLGVTTRVGLFASIFLFLRYHSKNKKDFHFYPSRKKTLFLSPI
jgi:hypothetical protein